MKYWLYLKVSLPLLLIFTVLIKSKYYCLFLYTCFLSIFVFSALALQGSLAGWLTKDIIADSGRFSALIIAFCAGAIAGQYPSRFEWHIKKYFHWMAFFWLASFAIVVTQTALLGFDYARERIMIIAPLSMLAFIFYRFELRKKLGFIICSFFIVCVMINQSKAYLIAAIIMTVYFYYSYKVLFLSLIVFSVGAVGWEYLAWVPIIDRFNSLFSLAVAGSSSARIAEILNIVYTFVQKPNGIYFGFGSGSLWYDNLGIYYGGLSTAKT